MKHIVKTRRGWLAAAVAALLSLAAVAVYAAWRLWPTDAQGMRLASVVVEQRSWHEVTADGHPVLYFGDALGDSALLGVTANRDSAAHRRLSAGCWADATALWPSCRGRVLSVTAADTGGLPVTGDSAIARLCRASIDSQLETLGEQKAELAYYLRVHGVQDNGYQAIAALAQRVGAAYDDVARARRVIDSLSTGRHRLALVSRTSYAAIRHTADGRVERVALTRVAATNVGTPSRPKQAVLLQTADRSTPSGAQSVTMWPWSRPWGRDLRAVTVPGLGEEGLACDTVSPVVMRASRLRGKPHDLPRLFAADGTPVFSRHGRFVGLVSGDTIVGRAELRRLME